MFINRCLDYVQISVSICVVVLGINLKRSSCILFCNKKSSMYHKINMTLCNVYISLCGTVESHYQDNYTVHKHTHRQTHKHYLTHTPWLMHTH